MNWRTLLALLTLGVVATSSEKDKGVVEHLRQNNNGGEPPLLPEQSRFLNQVSPMQVVESKDLAETNQVPQMQVVEESKDLAETYEELFSSLDMVQKRGAVDNAKWNSALEKLTPDQQKFFAQVKELHKQKFVAQAKQLQKPRNLRKLPDGRVLNIAGVVCQPVNLFLGLDGSNTQGQLSIVKQAGSQSMGEVTPVNTGVIVFGNVARVVVPFGPAGSVTANQAAISSIPPGVAGPGTNIAALFDTFLAQLQANPVTNNYPIIFEVMSDYKNTVGTEAGVVAAYTRLSNYVKATYPNHRFKVVGFAVPGASGTDLALAQQTSRDFDGVTPDAQLYPTAPKLLDGVTAESQEFCVAPPVATATPTVQKTEAPVPAPERTEAPTSEGVPPEIPGTIVPLAIGGAFAWWFRSRTQKQYVFEPNPEFEAKVKEVIRTSGSTQPGEDDASFALRVAEYEKRLKEYNDWLVTPDARNDVNAVPSKQPGANNKPGVNLIMQTEYGIPLTSGYVANRGVDDGQGVHQAPTRPTPPIRRPNPETGDQIRQRLANDPSMPPPFNLVKKLGRNYATGLLSPFHTLLSTWKKGIGPEVKEMNPPETQPTEASAQRTTFWQKLKGLVVGELRNENVGKAFTRIKDNSPGFIRKPVSAVSVGVQYIAQGTYGLASFILIYAPIRFFTPRIEFAGFTPNGRDGQVTRQDLEEIKKMPNLTVEQQRALNRIDTDKLPVAKAGYQIIWDKLQSVFKSNGTSRAATGPVVPPVLPPSDQSSNPVYGREFAAASRTESPPPRRETTAESVEPPTSTRRTILVPPESAVTVSRPESLPTVPVPPPAPMLSRPVLPRPPMPSNPKPPMPSNPKPTSTRLPPERPSERRMPPPKPPTRPGNTAASTDDRKMPPGAGSNEGKGRFEI